MKSRTTLQGLTLALSLSVVPSAQALGNYIGVAGPFVGMGLDTNSNSSGSSILAGIRFESVALPDNISAVLSAFMGFGVGFPGSDALSIDAAALSAYMYFGGLLRYEDVIFKFGNYENDTGLYYNVGGGAYYGRALNFTVDGSTIALTDEELAEAKSSTQVIDPVVTIGLKLLLDFNKKFGIYPFFDYELIPFRSYFKTTYTDKKMKHRFLLGMNFAFSWD